MPDHQYEFSSEPRPNPDVTCDIARPPEPAIGHTSNGASPGHMDDTFERSTVEADEALHRGSRANTDDVPIGIFEVDPRLCEPFPGAPRAGIEYDDRRDQELADNIRQHGVLEPVVAWSNGSGLQLISGNRRIAIACHLLELGETVLVPCRLFMGSAVEALAFAHACNEGREIPTAMEQGKAIARALESLGQTQADVARALGFGEAKVSRLLTLAHLPPFVLQAATNPNSLSENFAAKLQASLANKTTCAEMERRAKRLERLNKTLPGPKLAQYLLTGRDETEVKKIEDRSGKLIAQLSVDRHGSIQVKITPAYAAKDADWEGMLDTITKDLKELAQQTRAQRG